MRVPLSGLEKILHQNSLQIVFKHPAIATEPVKQMVKHPIQMIISGLSPRLSTDPSLQTNPDTGQ